MLLEVISEVQKYAIIGQQHTINIPQSFKVNNLFLNIIFLSNFQ